MGIVEHLLENGFKFHSELIYDYDKKIFLIQPYPNKVDGVYFIASKENGELKIQKVGKADGKGGLQKRIKDYRLICDNKHNLFYNEIMHNQLKNSILYFYVYECKEQPPIKELGFYNKVTIARNLELNIAESCEMEGHPLLLSKCK